MPAARQKSTVFLLFCTVKPDFFRLRRAEITGEISKRRELTFRKIIGGGVLKLITPVKRVVAISDIGFATSKI